jgi:hypothetical protein
MAPAWCGITRGGPDNVWLGDPKFAPVYEGLNRRKAIAYTHPNTAACCTNLIPGIADTVVEYGTSTTRAIATMVFGGFDRKHPDIKVIFSHAGDTMPYLIERFEFQAISGKYKQEMSEGVHPGIQARVGAAGGRATHRIRAIPHALPGRGIARQRGHLPRDRAASAGRHD